VPGVNAHLDEFTLLRYTVGDLAGDENRTTASHLAACGHCSSRLAGMALLDRELRRLTSADAGEELASAAFPETDPFRARPVPIPREGPRKHGGVPTDALQASESAFGNRQRFLDAAAQPEALAALFAGLIFREPEHRFALLYGLQAAGHEIARSPGQALSFAEASILWLRSQRSSSDEEDLDRAEQIVPRAVLWGQAHVLAAHAHLWKKSFTRAHECLRTAYESFGEIGDESNLALVELTESQRRSFEGEGSTALVLARRARNTFGQLGLEDFEARAMVAEGLAYSALGRREDAVALYRTAVPIFERCQLWSNLVGALNSIGTALMKMDRVDEARREYARALRRFSQDQHRTWLGFLREGLGEILLAAGRYREAASSLGRASRSYAECGLRANALLVSLLEIESWALAGDIARAIHRLDLFRAEVRQGGEPLDPSVMRAIEAALSGARPDIQRIATLRKQIERVVQESSPALRA
jgi:tetratricopeptide (TPR) repeat protein